MRNVWALIGLRYISLVVEDEHGVAIGAEAVFLVDGDLIGVHRLVVAAEGCLGHQHDGVGHVEVGHQGVAGGALVGREQELVGPAPIGLDVAVHTHAGLKSAQHRGADGADLVAAVAQAVDFFGEFDADVHFLAVHTVLGKVLDVDVAVAAQADVHGEEVAVDVADFHAAHQFAREVQTGGGSHHGAFLAGEDGLVTLGVLGFGVAGDVVGQGRVALVVQVFLELVVVAVIEETQGAAARGGIVDDLGHHRVVKPEVELVADANLAGGLHEHIPQLVVGIEFAQQEHLDTCSRLLLVAEEFGGEDLGVVEYKQVMGVEVVKYVLEHFMFNLVALLVEYH